MAGVQQSMASTLPAPLSAGLFSDEPFDGQLSRANDAVGKKKRRGKKDTKPSRGGMGASLDATDVSALARTLEVPGGSGAPVLAAAAWASPNAVPEPFQRGRASATIFLHENGLEKDAAAFLSAAEQAAAGLPGSAGSAGGRRPFAKTPEHMRPRPASGNTMPLGFGSSRPRKQLIDGLPGVPSTASERGKLFRRRTPDAARLTPLEQAAEADLRAAWCDNGDFWKLMVVVF